MQKEQQILIMESQLIDFTTMIEKLQYISARFDTDPIFTQEAIDIVRSNISKAPRMLYG